MGLKRKWMACILALALALCGCGEAPDSPPSTEDATQPTTPKATGNLICVEISRFNGDFVEDGTDERVQDVAAILVANNTGKFLELATVTYQVGDRTATFLVTGLPSGRRAWVLESNRMSITEGDELVLEECKDTYNPNAMETTDALAVSRQGKSLTVTNVSGKTLNNVVVYYKNTVSAEDTTFLGGITYYIVYGKMEPGDTLTQSKDHFGATSEIVRYSYQEA